MKEEKLIKNARTRKGQKLIFDQYYTQMLAVANRYVKVNEDAQDVLCEAFIRVFNRVHDIEYRGEGSLTRYIKTIVINECLRFLGRKSKLEFNDDIYDADLEFTDTIDGELDMAYFLEIINTLPDGYRIVFMMFVIEGYTHKEIAKELDITESTSKTQLFKARSLLMKKLKKAEIDETYTTRK